MNDYARAIEILMAPGCDRHDLLIKVAQCNPAAIVRAYEGKLSTWMKDVDAFLYQRDKISAIKLWRAEAGTTLKEAKDAVERRQEELGV